MTLQNKIYKASKLPNRRQFSIAIRKTAPYVSNMLNSKSDISVNLAIDFCDLIGIDREKSFELIVEHIREKIFYY